MIALSVVKMYAETFSVGLCWRCTQKAVFGGIDGMGQLTLETKWYNSEICLPPKHVLWCNERQSTFYGLLRRRSQEIMTHSVHKKQPMRCDAQLVQIGRGRFGVFFEG